MVRGGSDMPRNTNNSTKRKMEPAEDVSFVGKRAKAGGVGGGVGALGGRSSRSSRSVTEEPASFSQKKCITWFKMYSSPGTPETIGWAHLLYASATVLCL